MLLPLESTALRAALAALASFVLALALGPHWIGWLRRHFREPIKSASPDVARLHRAKQATPTMGGLFIVASLVVTVLLLANWRNPYVPIVLMAVLALATLGACDDLIKLRTSARGLPMRAKLAAQTAIGLAVAAWLYAVHRQCGVPLDLALPCGGPQLALGWLFIPWAAVVIVGASNAVNLADGLDGLAGGCLVCATAAMGLVSFVTGHAEWADYLGLPHVAGVREMIVVAAGVSGGLFGFLWFNCHPASVFMGDTGSLPLGGLLGVVALVARQELLLVAIGGVFVVEALSVIAQVGWFRYTGRRIFLCAPLHHHFQLRGWPEDKIVVRFWIAAALCAAGGLAMAAGSPRAISNAFQLPQLTSVDRDPATQSTLPR